MSACLLAVAPCYAQTYLKLNALTTLIGIPQIGIETSICKKLTFQADALGAYWGSVNKAGAPFKTVMVFSELRYHFNHNYKGLYVGGHIGGAIYQLQKWNYWNSDSVQKGESFFLGISVGYQFLIKNRWMIDAFVGGGNQQAHYTGRLMSTGERYEHSSYNKSGEWLPYRGGVMISYKL